MLSFNWFYYPRHILTQSMSRTNVYFLCVNEILTDYSNEQFIYHNYRIRLKNFISNWWVENFVYTFDFRCLASLVFQAWRLSWTGLVIMGVLWEPHYNLWMMSNWSRSRPYSGLQGSSQPRMDLFVRKMKGSISTWMALTVSTTEDVLSPLFDTGVYSFMF